MTLFMPWAAAACSAVSPAALAAAGSPPSSMASATASRASRSSAAGMRDPCSADATGLYDEKSRRSLMNALPPPRL